MGTTKPGAGDGIDVLRAQHRTIRTLVAAVAAEPADGRQDCLDLLCGCLASHEAAEDRLLRPVTRACVVGGEVIADARGIEESRARRALDELTALDGGSEPFRAAFHDFALRLFEHFDSEERYEFPLIRAYRDEAALAAMGAVLRRSAPVVPEGGPGTGGMAGAVLSPLASAVGKVRNAVGAAKP